MASSRSSSLPDSVVRSDVWGVTVKKVSEDAQTERGKGDLEKIPSKTSHLLTFCGSLASLEKICGSKPFGGGGGGGGGKRGGSWGTHMHTLWQQGKVVGAATTPYSYN